MSISLRNFEEKDLEAVQALMVGEVDSSLSTSDHLQLESLKPCMLGDTVFGLVAEEDDKIIGTVSIVMEQETPQTVVGLLCRLCVADGPERSTIATSLVSTALQSLEGNLQVCFAEIPTTDLWAQAACEQSGFVSCGFLPQKFRTDTRGSSIVYIYLSEIARNTRRPHPKIISSAKNLAAEVLKAHGMIEDAETRDDTIAYSFDCNFTMAPIDSDAVQTMLQGQTPQETETFHSLQGTQTRLHLPIASTTYLAAKDKDHVIGVIGYIFDSFDKRVQITDIIALSERPEGFMLAQLLEQLTGDSAPDYWEVLVSAHAPRMQKTFDRLGFVPCAYLPAFGMEHGLRTDAIKMVKLNANYESDSSELTSTNKNIFSIIDTIFREQSVGSAVLKLLQDLRIFRGMGEGELRRVARLFSQKLFRPGEVVFEEGSTGQELYVVERGEIEIRTKEGNKLLGSICKGAVLGEIAFLNGQPRTASAISKSATIVRVIYRSDFDRLIHGETHLGQVFFKNMALDLADKLQHSVAQAKGH